LWDNYACAEESQNSDYYHKVQFLFSQLIIINSEIIPPDAEKRLRSVYEIHIVKCNTIASHI